MKAEESQKLIRVLNRIGPRDTQVLSPELLEAYASKIKEEPLRRPTQLRHVFRSIGCDNDVAEAFAQELLTYATLKVAEADARAHENKMSRYALRGANRTKYVFEAIFKYYQYRQGGPDQEPAWRWVFDRELRNHGLIAHMVRKLGISPEIPIAFNILNQDGLSKRASSPIRHRERWLGERAKLYNAGIAISGDRLGWNYKHPGFGMVLRALPLAHDLSGYGHSLYAPTLPEGYLDNIPVVFGVVKDGNGSDCQTDGSGIYHPDCPHMAGFVAKYGKVACQVRGLHPGHGGFFKGVIFPSELALGPDGEPCILADWAMMKGKGKAGAKESRKQDKLVRMDGFHVGILNAWYRPGKLSACFELLENVRRNAETEEIVTKLVTRSMQVLRKRGFGGLATEVGRKDPVIKTILDLLTLAKEEKINLRPTQIPRIRRAVSEKLGRKLIKIADGGGIALPSKVARLDANLEPGTCVVAGMEAGKQVVGFRFPLILPQGLIQLTTVEPQPHHLVNGAEVPFSIIMHPSDLTIGMQGDDDGDFVGITDDPLLVELFKHRLDEKRFLIEPKGAPIYGRDGKELMANSEEGLKWIADDHRGEVGLMTVYRAQLLAAGDEAGARALAILIQECVDAAKRRPEWSDWRLAVNLTNWTECPDGYRFHHKLQAKDLLPNGKLNVKMVQQWVEQRLKEQGCYDMVTEQTMDGEYSNEKKSRNPLWYRLGTKGKIDPENWSVPENGEKNAKFENLVHHAYRVTHAQWMEMAEDFLKEDTAPEGVATLLQKLLETRGFTPTIRPLDRLQVLELRGKLGISDHNEKLRSLFKAPPPSNEAEFHNRQSCLNTWQEELNAKLLRAYQSNEVSIDDLCSLWYYEWVNYDPRDEKMSVGKPNNAVKMICFPQSPIMQVLGLTEETHCNFLFSGKVNRLKWVIETCSENPEPFEKLRSIIEADVKHQAEHTDQNGDGIPLSACEWCMNELQTSLVRLQRTKRAGVELQYLLQIKSQI